MKQQTPWQDDHEAQALLADARKVEPWTTSERALGWWRIAEAATPKPRRRWLAFAGSTVALAASAALVLLLSSPQRGDVLKFDPGAQYAVIDAQALKLDLGAFEGTIAARPGNARFNIQTPHVSVHVSGTKVLVHVETHVSTVRVFEGEAVVRTRGGKALTLRPGDSLRSDDPRFSPAPAPAVTPAPPRAEVEAPRTSCDDEPAPSLRAACLERVARGGGLAAETALYTLALEATRQGEDARARWRTYQTRFPEGVFAPEVSLALMAEHEVRGDRARAIDEADAFLERFPEDARGEEVATWREALDISMKLPDGR